MVDLVAEFRRRADNAGLASETASGPRAVSLTAEARVWAAAAERALQAKHEQEEATRARLAHFRRLAEQHRGQTEPYTLGRAEEVLLTRLEAGEGLPEDLLLLDALERARRTLEQAQALVGGVL